MNKLTITQLAKLIGLVNVETKEIHQVISMLPKDTKEVVQLYADIDENEAIIAVLIRMMREIAGQ